MTEAEWLACAGNADWREFLDDMQACLKGRCSERQLRLFAFACCRHINPQYPDRRSIQALDIAERYVDGRASEEEYEAAYNKSKEVLYEFQVILNEVGCLSPGEPSAAANVIDTAVVFAKRCSELAWGASYVAYYVQRLGDHESERRWQAQVLCDIVGEFEPLPEFNRHWRTDAASALAGQMYESREFSAMPGLADALQEAGCGNGQILGHCRGPGLHVRGCWVVDLVAGTE
jgi:hypothetical protein